MLTTVGFLLLENFHHHFIFHFCGEKVGRKRNIKLHQMLHFFEILQGKKEEEIEMIASPDSLTLSQVKAAGCAFSWGFGSSSTFSTVKENMYI